MSPELTSAIKQAINTLREDRRHPTADFLEKWASAEIYSSPSQTTITEDQDYLDKCAIAAMQGMLSSDDISSIEKRVSQYAYNFAYAMLAERKERRGL